MQSIFTLEALDLDAALGWALRRPSAARGAGERSDHCRTRL